MRGHWHDWVVCKCSATLSWYAHENHIERKSHAYSWEMKTGNENHSAGASVLFPSVLSKYRLFFSKSEYHGESSPSVLYRLALHEWHRRPFPKASITRNDWSVMSRGTMLAWLAALLYLKVPPDLP